MYNTPNAQISSGPAPDHTRRRVPETALRPPPDIPKVPLGDVRRSRAHGPFPSAVAATYLPVRLGSSLFAVRVRR
jgi:hypothetical protein